tara:strand:+ start:1434 stop:2156 length:723 start_codon:yes stop_codon:yes gene_type:complete
MKITYKRLRRIIKEELDLAFLKEAGNPFRMSNPAGAVTATTLQAIKTSLSSGNMDEAQAFAAFPLLVFGNPSQLAMVGIRAVTSSTVPPSQALADKLKAKGIPLASDWAAVHGVTDNDGALGSAQAGDIDIEEVWPNALIFAIQMDISPATRQLTTRLGGDEAYGAAGESYGKSAIIQAKIHSAIVDAVLETADTMGIELNRASVAGTLAVDVSEAALRPLHGRPDNENKKRYDVAVWNR